MTDHDEATGASFIAEYTIDNPIGKATRRAVPTVEVEVEDERSGERPHLVVWLNGPEDDLERFLRELPADPSIDEFEILSTLPERRLARITLTDEGEEGLTYPDAIAFDITFLEVTAQGTTIEYRAQFPDRDALVAYRQRCAERDLSFDLRSLYRRDETGAEAYGLTDRQRDALRRALEAGYFDVPRETSTGDLAAEFDISSQALSALLRRGQRTLLRRTVADEDAA